MHPRAANEIDRYISWPGQALAYKVGQLTISRREKATKALGADFDLSVFMIACITTRDVDCRLPTGQDANKRLRDQAQTRGAGAAVKSLS